MGKQRKVDVTMNTHPLVALLKIGEKYYKMPRSSSGALIGLLYDKIREKWAIDDDTVVELTLNRFVTVNRSTPSPLQINQILDLENAYFSVREILLDKIVVGFYHHSFSFRVGFDNASNVLYVQV